MQKDAIPRLYDILQSIKHIRDVLDGVAFAVFEADWQKRWLVERGVEIISEASRHLGEDLKDRHPEIPWRRVAGIGNILRHDYNRAAPEVLWKLAQSDLPLLERVCREEFDALGGGDLTAP